MELTAKTAAQMRWNANSSYDKLIFGQHKSQVGARLSATLGPLWFAEDLNKLLSMIEATNPLMIAAPAMLVHRIASSRKMTLNTKEIATSAVRTIDRKPARSKVNAH